jgi:hypothetical protein
MKTKTLLLLCLFSGIGLTQLVAQTKSYPDRFFMTSEEYYLENPVYCSGVQGEVDRLVLDYFVWQGVTHYKDGISVFTNSKLTGQCHSKRTGEVFTYKEIDKSPATSTSYTAKFNLIGDHGNHYIQTFVIEYVDADLILHPDVIRAICN